MQAYPHPHFRLLFASLLFLLVAFMLTGSGLAMFTDTDPLWHILAGDLIRQTHQIPQTDPWSFTAVDYRWLNIAWGWDIIMSYLHAWNGWHAAMAANAIIIAATIALIFAHCLTRCQKFLPAILATFGAVTLLSLSLRPLQVSNAMTALWLFMLASIMRKTISPLWLLTFPLLTIYWANTHGGFIMAPLLIAAFFVQALLSQQYALARNLAITLAATFAAIFLNPYGADIVEATRRPLTTVANHFIREWQPFTFTWANVFACFDVFAFLLLSLTPRLPLLPIERALALFWCALSFTANRYLSLFAIMAAPTIACALAAWLPALPLSATMLKAYNKKPLALAALAASLLTTLWLPTAPAARYFKQQAITPPQLREEIAFMQSHPTRYLTHFNLASIVTYETRGQIPVFVDPRTETAFPPEVLQAYLTFQKSLPGWEQVLETYNIGGVVLPLPGHDAENDAITAHLHALPGWFPAFTGPTAIIFLRQSH